MDTADPQLNGLLLVDKPEGLSSFDIIRRLRQTTGFKKIGHAGTLDPLATGLMLMLFGPTCKKASEFSGLDKTYVAEITLGANSTTGDREGEKVVVSDAQPTREQIESVVKQFIGQITQTPSQYSAIKINGTEAYKLARAGKTVDMPSRQVVVHSITIDNYDYPIIQVTANVSSGTYIRSLAEDIGAVLGAGAYLSALRRTTIGAFDLDQAHQLDQVTRQTIEADLLDITA